MDSDSDSDEDVSDLHDDEEDSVLIRSGHARQVAWLSNIREWQEEFLGVLTAEEFVDTVTGDLLGRRVFVFTPTGGVMNLPHGSTVVDFAFYTDAWSGRGAMLGERRAVRFRPRAEKRRRRRDLPRRGRRAQRFRENVFVVVARVR
jgi:hypothetical protein